MPGLGGDVIGWGWERGSRETVVGAAERNAHIRRLGGAGLQDVVHDEVKKHGTCGNGEGQGGKVAWPVGGPSPDNMGPETEGGGKPIAGNERAATEPARHAPEEHAAFRVGRGVGVDKCAGYDVEKWKHCPARCGQAECGPR